MLRKRAGAAVWNFAAICAAGALSAATALFSTPALAQAPAGSGAPQSETSPTPAVAQLRVRLPEAVEVLKEARIHFDQEVNDYNTALKAVDDSDAHYRAAYRQYQQLAASLPQARAQGGQASADQITEQETAADQSARMWLGQIQQNDVQAARLYSALQQDQLFPYAVRAGQPLSEASDVRQFAASQHWADVNPDLRFLSLNRSWPTAPVLTTAGPDQAKQVAAAQRLVALANAVRPVTVAYLQGLVNRYDDTLARLNTDQEQLKQANLALSRAGAQGRAASRSTPRYRGRAPRSGIYNATSSTAAAQYYAAAARENITAADARLNTDHRAAEAELAVIKEYRLLFPQNFTERATPGRPDLPTITRRTA